MEEFETINMNKESKKPFFSVIIPIYNAAKYLSQCLDSILKQTYTNFEVLLVDDGSTDDSSNICFTYISKDKRFRYIKKENGGAYQTRIYGTERICGKYIMFCDADDFYVHNNVFMILHNELSKGNYSAMQFGYIKKYNHMKKKNDLSIKYPLEISKKLFFLQEYPKLLCSFWEKSHLSLNVWNKVYQRGLFENLMHSDSVEKIFWGDDLILNLQLLSKCESFKFIPDTLYCYRQFSGGTNRFSLHTMKDLDNIKKYQLFYLEQYQGDSKESIRKILFSEVVGWFYLYIQQGLDYLNDAELINLINESLQLPTFIQAREYYMNNKENWEAVNLLRKANAKEYIIKAKKCYNKKDIRQIIIKFVKKVYSSI